jgi:hypothetical protein
MTKPEIMFQWREGTPMPMERHIAAKIIRGNRRAKPELRITVTRRDGATHIASDKLNAHCRIYRRADR